MAKKPTYNKQAELARKLDFLMDVVLIDVEGPDGQKATVSASQLYNLAKDAGLRVNNG